MRIPRTVLVVGVGGIGSEVFKTVLLTGCGQVTVVDRDTVDETNLHRQFLFRAGDVDKGKSEVACSRAARREGQSVEWLHCDAETLPSSFFLQFEVVFLCVDSLQTRFLVNSSVVCPENTGTVLIDCGSSGYVAHCKVVVSGHTSCLECISDLFYKEKNPVCQKARAEKTALPDIVPTPVFTNAVIAGVAVEAMLRTHNKAGGDDYFLYSGGNVFSYSVARASFCPRCYSAECHQLEPEKDISVGEFVAEMERKYKDTVVLVTSHGEILYSKNKSYRTENFLSSAMRKERARTQWWGSRANSLRRIPTENHHCLCAVLNRTRDKRV
ncbi:MAG: NEDD8-activating enzyme E1 catalytic subunit [Amphiamblys sp. WSBS2006]|nr:MAG: NEDD8-activating enzyme E1 catalytic subunit [Amphiamblys sp. WSBS2006]